MEWYKDGRYPEWFLSGKNFSPMKLKEKFPKLIIVASYEKDEINKIDRNKGKLRGYGSCVIVVPEKIVYKIDWLLKFILNNQQAVRTLGVTDELIWITWYGVQGNMELSIKQIKKIAKTGNRLNMNYYYVQND